MSQQEQSESFSSVFRSLREQAGKDKTGLTYEELADYLCQDTEHVIKIETGLRKPPREGDFYEMVARTPNIGLKGLEALLNAKDAPSLIDLDPDAATAHITTPQGLEVTIYAYPGRFTDQELLEIKPQAMVGKEEFLRRLAESWPELQNSSS